MSELAGLPPQWIVEILKMWGPAAILLLGFFLYVPRNAISSFIASERDQAIALARLSLAAESIADQGTRLEEKLLSVDLNQRLMVDQLERIEQKAEHHQEAVSVQMKLLQELLLSGRKVQEPGDPAANT